jgi:hypothetical protein
MSLLRAAAVVLGVSVPLSALADGPAVVRDLQSLSPVTLTKAELQQLLPGAKMARVSANGSNQSWSNDSDGTMIVHSDNRMFSSGRTTTSSKWHISDDGRYCVLIPWKRVATEEWCRFVIKTSSGYFLAKSASLGDEKVFKFDIDK